MRETIFGNVITVLEIIGMMIIVIGIIKMLILFTMSLFKKLKLSNLITEIRVELGNYLVLSLEVFIGRDIIETLLKPTLEEITTLAALVLLRTILAFFLNYEIAHLESNELKTLFKRKTK
ncbi:DUF1622 domain-containing protein [Patescibacteria group bacterium]|nr:DUF1622 domain-containing protein [Patescibacteria group bacterium]